MSCVQVGNILAERFWKTVIAVQTDTCWHKLKQELAAVATTELM